MPVAMEEVESKTITKVVASVEACLKVLTSLWDETGLNQSDRIDQHKDLIADVERALQGRVNEAKDLKAKQCLKLRLASVRIKTVYTQLGCECPPEFQSYKVPNPDDDDAKSSWVDNKTSRPSLQAQLNNLEEILAAAEAQRVVRFEIISAKAEHLRSLLLEQHDALSEEQEANVKVSGDVDLSEEREDVLDSALKEAKEAQQDRILAISDLVSELQSIWAEIGEERNDPEWAELDEKVQQLPHSLETSVAMMQQLQQRAAMLRATQEERSVKVAEQKETLRQLWRRTKVGEQEQEAYLAEHAGLQLATMAAHAQRIEQLDAQLGSMLAKLISEATDHARELRILVMEDKDPTRDASAALPKQAGGSAPTREALERVEAEIARLEGRLEKRVPVLKQVERRAAILKEAVELRSAATDPSRLLDRGGNSFRIRQQEERRRNLVGKELPRLTEKLRKMVVEWEESEGEPFVLSGRRFLEAMDEERAREEKERDEEKERERQRREMVKSVRANGGPSGAVPASPSMSPAPRPSPMRPQTAGSVRREPRFNTHPPQPSPKPHVARASSKHPVLQHSQSAKDLERSGGTASADKENGDNYYTAEERTEIGREVLREMQERHEELRSAKKRIKFKKGELLGAGSFGQVFLGLNEGTGELLAVKEVDCSKAGEAAITSLEAEIEMLQQLRHPNIVAYYGVERGENLSVLVEYCAGGSIASVIQTFGALNEQVVRSYTRQILVGLDYLHKHCIVHRDVKCANVLLDADGNVKVADFGASRKMSSINGEAAAMSMKGTPFFMAPEVIKQTAVGRQSDLWSVGCCVVEMCTSRPPFANQFSNVAALLWHIAKSVAPPVLPEGLSQECHDFCALCFKREPEERPSARRLLRHPFVATWNVEAAKQRINANTSQNEDSRLSVAANRRISALF